MHCFKFPAILLRLHVTSEYIILFFLQGIIESVVIAGNVEEQKRHFYLQKKNEKHILPFIKLCFSVAVISETKNVNNGNNTYQNVE